MTGAAARRRLIVGVMGRPAALRGVVQALHGFAQLPVDSAGVDGYVGQLLSGAGEDAVLADILSSASYYASV
jgi:hypothetical protein